ncbi:MAG: DUF5605 domain-containing protein [Clostridia bacterium]|nr:DUF5605 domain-containing protein [Clostridia bacterium]
MTKVERWGTFEAAVNGRCDGNPYIDYPVRAVFTGRNEQVSVDGFYDGDGVYRVRFMPSFEGEYAYRITSPAFDGAVEGSFTAVAPSGDNHGPVRVANTHHFAHEDGTPYYPAGTTCYVWELQEEAVQRKTLAELKKGYFNKIRFCLFPKHYDYNLREPATYPFERGHREGLDEAAAASARIYPPVAHPDMEFDFLRPNPRHFQHIDECVAALRDMGIEADLIVMHPYDRWGFSRMTGQADDLYWKYVVARYAAYRNVWWSLANEYDLMPQKRIADWERYASILCTKDPYQHLRSIHNCIPFYDYARPWITHCCMQRQDLYRHVEYTDEYRLRYGKPVVWDEIAYEGNINHGWGNISGQELVRRFWEASMRGGYAGHGETFMSDEDILWWSHGGDLHGESPERIRFLRRILSETPGVGLKRGEGSFDEVVGVPDSVFAGDEYEIHYYGFGRPSFRDFHKNPGARYRIQVIDTWEMTIADCGVFSGDFRIPLPGREYMAIRVIRQD